MTKCGYVAIIGRPNVGKSTLLNKILGQKISITCRKPQTTRHQILGVKTHGDVQAMYVDTPGIHNRRSTTLNRQLNRTAKAVIFDVEVVVFILEGTTFNEEDEAILKVLQRTDRPIVLVINKIDCIKNKKLLLPFIKKMSTKLNFVDVVPISAKQGTSVEYLEEVIAKFLPQADFLYEEDEITDKPVRFLVAEIVREKLTRMLGEELPYELTVDVDYYKDEKKLTRIAATIYVNRDSQKAIVIGKNGAKLKEVGRAARVDIEKLIDKKVYLQLWVKVMADWADKM